MSIRKWLILDSNPDTLNSIFTTVLALIFLTNQVTIVIFDEHMIKKMTEDSEGINGK